MNQRFCNGMVHVIKEGETLYQLSRMYRVPVALLLRANPYVDVYNLQIGQEICIPVGRPAFPGMMPPFGRPPRRNSLRQDGMIEEVRENRRAGDSDEERQRAETEEREPAERTERMREESEEEVGMPPMPGEIPVEESAVRDDEPAEEMPYVIMDGQRSLGEMLQQEKGMLSGLLDVNDIKDWILAEGVRVYLPKKV